MIFHRRQCRAAGARGTGLVRRNLCLNLFRAHLRNQRVAKLETAEAAKVPIGCPQFAHTVESAQSGHARIVDVRAGDPPVPHHGFELTPVSFRLRQQRKARRFQPRVDLIDRCERWSVARRFLDA